MELKSWMNEAGKHTYVIAEKSPQQHFEGNNSTMSAPDLELHLVTIR
jgi:hypothetical protein